MPGKRILLHFMTRHISCERDAKSVPNLLLVVLLQTTCLYKRLRRYSLVLKIKFFYLLCHVNYKEYTTKFSNGRFFDCFRWENELHTYPINVPESMSTNELYLLKINIIRILNLGLES